MCLNRVYGWATDLACFLSGSQYGQMGNDPQPPEELADDSLLIGSVRRLVCDGRRAALARRDGDEARAALHRETVPKLRGLIKPASADELFSIGYRSVLGK